MFSVQVIESREDLADFLQEHSTLTPGERCHDATVLEYDRRWIGMMGMGYGRHKADALTTAFGGIVSRGHGGSWGFT